MQIGQILAGYTLGGADVLRRAMGKKKPEEMAKQRSVFIEGCRTNNIDEALSSNIFDLVEKFAGYGFNKSHSVAYAVLSYQTAWLKAHYPAEFYSAVLTADRDVTDKVVRTVEDLLVNRCELLPPDINESDTDFTAVGKRSVRYGLAAIKGVGEGVIDKILEERNSGGKFTNLFNLCQRIDGANVNRSVLENLVNAGAMDSLATMPDDAAINDSSKKKGFKAPPRWQGRATLSANLGLALNAADQQARAKERGQSDLFADVVSTDLDLDLQTDEQWVEPWSELERLAAERKATGLYLTGHPIEPYLAELGKITSGRLIDQCSRVAHVAGGQNARTGNRGGGVEVVVAGLVTDIRIRTTNRGGKLLSATVDDCTAKIDMVVMGDTIDMVRAKLSQDAIVVIEGALGIDAFSGGYSIKAKQVYSMEEARKRFARMLLVTWQGGALAGGSLTEIQTTLAGYRDGGRLPVVIDYANGDATARIRLGEEWQINPSTELIESLHLADGVSHVGLVY